MPIRLLKKVVLKNLHKTNMHWEHFWRKRQKLLGRHQETSFGALVRHWQMWTFWTRTGRATTYWGKYWWKLRNNSNIGDSIHIFCWSNPTFHSYCKCVTLSKMCLCVFMYLQFSGVQWRLHVYMGRFVHCTLHWMNLENVGSIYFFKMHFCNTAWFQL